MENMVWVSRATLRAWRRRRRWVVWKFFVLFFPRSNRWSVYCLSSRANEWTRRNEYSSEKPRWLAREPSRGKKKTKTKTNSSNSLRFNFVRETQYLLNFTKSNVIQTCHDRDWVKLNKKLDTRPNFTKFHTTRDRNEWKLQRKGKPILIRVSIIEALHGRKFTEETIPTLYTFKNYRNAIYSPLIF